MIANETHARRQFIMDTDTDTAMDIETGTIFSFVDGETVLALWPPHKAYYLAQVYMRVVCGTDPTYHVYFPEDDETREFVPEKELRRLQRLDDLRNSIWATPRAEVKGRLFKDGKEDWVVCEVGTEDNVNMFKCRNKKKFKWLTIAEVYMVLSVT